MDTKLKETLKILVTNVKTFMSGNYLAKNTTRTSDLINDGEGGSPVDKFAKESAIVQSNWLENDNTKASFVINRTHYGEIIGEEYRYGGGTEVTYGDPTSLQATYDYYSDQVTDMATLTQANLIGRKFSYIMDSEGTGMQEITAQDITVDSNNNISIFDGLIRVIYQTTVENGETFYAGIYIVKGLIILGIVVNVETYILSSKGVNIKQLDGNYIPDYIPRVCKVINNILDGSGTNSLRQSGSAKEDSNYTVGNNSIALGEGTKAPGVNQLVFGKNNIPDTQSNYIEVVGNGGINSQANARTLDWSGNEVLAGDLSIGKTLGNGTLMVEGGYGNSSLSLISHAGSNQGAQGTLNIVSEKRGIMNIAALSALGSCGVINISTFTQSLSDMTQMSGSNGGINIYTEKLNLFNQNSSSQGLFINTFGHLQSSGNSFTVENTGEGQTGTNLYLIAQPGEGATGPGYAHLQGKGNPNSGAGGYVYVEATGSGSGGGGYLYLTASGSQDTASSGSGGQVIITANGAGNAGGGTINISAYAGQNGTGRSGGAINISAQSGTSDSSISIAADTITLNGAVKQLKKSISPSLCTPDTYYCPTSAIVSLVCNDDGFTGDYNYTFSGCFTADTGMTQMPTQTDYQSITMTWYGDIGIEAGERYMFCSTKVSATEYVGVVTKLV